MNKICTSLEQSKKLMELGIDVNTADMGWNVFVDKTIRLLPIDDWDLVKDGSGNVKFYPAWSLTVLLMLMPERIKIGEELSFCLTSKKSSTGFSFGYNLNGSTFVKDDPLDAAFEMVCWLKENKKI